MHIFVQKLYAACKCLHKRVILANSRRGNNLQQKMSKFPTRLSCRMWELFSSFANFLLYHHGLALSRTCEKSGVEHTGEATMKLWKLVSPRGAKSKLVMPVTSQTQVTSGTGQTASIGVKNVRTNMQFSLGKGRPDLVLLIFLRMGAD